MILKTRVVKETIKIGELFNKLHIDNSVDAQHLPDFNIWVKTPYGNKKIINLFRTALQETCTCYFGNNKTLVCSLKHLLKTERGWLPVESICSDDIIETASGTTYLKFYKRHTKLESLYDISVDTVGCYYTNNIVSHNSTALMNIGAQGLRKGLNVVYFTLELYENYISQRYDAIITGIAAQNLKYHVDEIEAQLEKLPGRLLLQYYPTKTASCNTLRAYLNNLIVNGTKPDMVLVDYADLLKTAGRSKDSHHLDLENIYEDLRGLAGEYEVPVYTASQAGRAAADSEIISGEQVAGAYAKIMIGDFVISLSRKVTDKISGTGRWHIIKNRFGPDGLTLPSKINMSNGQMQIFEEASVQGKETQKTMDNGQEVLRKTLATKFREINQKPGDLG